MAIHVRPAQKSDLGELSDVLGRAFHDDPVSVWTLPDEPSRVRRLARSFGVLARHHHLAGGGVEVACDGPAIGAAALWDPPGRWKEPRRTVLAMLPGLIRAYGRRLPAAGQLSELMRAAHPEEPHWYLAVVGSDPAVRGRGYAQAVIRPRLQRCDAERCPAYLESSKLENVPYYQRFGFQVIGEIELPNGGPKLWRMWREPR